VVESKKTTVLIRKVQKIDDENFDVCRKTPTSVKKIRV
jgi:hypothetical protein